MVVPPFGLENFFKFQNIFLKHKDVIKAFKTFKVIKAFKAFKVIKAFKAFKAFVKHRKARLFHIISTIQGS